jgi:transcriptional regulator with XRE-family HTH domain
MLDKEVLGIIGNELRVIRTECRLTLSEVNEKSGISITTISNYENNKSQIYLNTILDLLKVYNVTPSIFFTRIATKM